MAHGKPSDSDTGVNGRRPGPGSVPQGPFQLRTPGWQPWWQPRTTNPNPHVDLPPLRPWVSLFDLWESWDLVARANKHAQEQDTVHSVTGVDSMRKCCPGRCLGPHCLLTRATL